MKTIHQLMFYFAMVGILYTPLACKEKQEMKMDENAAAIQGITLAQWSFHRELLSGQMTHLDFIRVSGEMGFDGVEYVNQFFKDKSESLSYLDTMNQVAAEAGVKQILIMIDGEGHLGDLDETKRTQAIENHKKWVRAAQQLGCHSIRVNAHGEGSADEVMEAVVDALGKLADYAQEYGINVLVENHGGYSSNGAWLAEVMRKVNRENCGTLPDFGNFCLKREGGAMWGTTCLEEYDKYLGVEEMMPFASAVSAKSYDFDENGEETTIDYKRMLDIIKSHPYNGYIGVEYEGNQYSEREGIELTKRLIERYL